MFTSLDLLVVAFMILTATTLLSLALMLLIRNRTAQRVFLYVTSALGLYLSWVGFRIGFGGMFPLQMVIGVVTALACIAAPILERLSKGRKGMERAARILSAAAIVIALINAVI